MSEREHNAPLERHVRVLVDAMRSFSSTPDVTVLLDLVAQRLATDVRAECLVALLDRTDETLLPLASATTLHLGAHRELMAAVRLSDAPELHHLLATGQSARSDTAWTAFSQAIGVHSVLVLPLMLRGSALGLLWLGRTAGAPPFDEQDLRLGENLAMLAAMSIGNARSLATEHAARQAARTMAGSVAHDFGNLLSIILSYADAMTMDVPADSPLRNDLAEITRAATRAGELSQQLAKLNQGSE